EAQKKAAAEAAKKPAPKTAADAKKPAEVAKKPAPANAVAAEAKKPATLPAKLEAPALSQMIDSAITRHPTHNTVKAPPLADDAESLRQISPDITGATPPADKPAAFPDSQDPNKRAKLTDELLDSPAYGRHQADIWQALMLPKSSDNRRLQ